MRSAVPKHFHPILGRRMVDWVIEAGRATRRRPARRRRLARRARRVRRQRRHGRGSGDAARHGRRRPRRPDEALGDHDGDVLVLSGDTPLLTRRAARASSSQTHRREQGRGDDPVSAEPPDPRVYGRIVRGARRRRAADRRRHRRDAGGAARSARSTRRSTSSAPTALWPALEQLQPKNVQGELYLTDAIEILVAAGEKVAAHIAADHRETDGVNTRVELAQRGRDPARPHQRAAHARAASRSSTRRPPGSSRPSSSRPTSSSSRSPYLRGEHEGRRRRRDRREHRRDRYARRSLTPSSAPSVTFAPARSSASPPRRAPSWRSRTRSIGDRTKVPHLSYIGDADIGEDTNIGAGAHHRQLRAQARASPRAARTIGRNVRTAIHNGFVAPVTIGDGAWIAAGSVITKDVPPDALAIARPRQENKEGYAARQRGD